jgi:hypothetical protein
MELRLVENIPGSGLDHLQRQAVFSQFPRIQGLTADFLTDTRALSTATLASELKVYVTGDGADVYEDTLMKVATAGDGIFCPTLILVGIRLGIDRVTPVYWDALKKSLQLPQSIGIAGLVLDDMQCSTVS